MPIRKLSETDLESELNKGALWAVTYGDLMSYLMIFFLIMFAFSIGKRGPGLNDKKVDESLVSITQVFHGQIDEARLRRMEQRRREEAAARKLQEAAEASQGAMEIKANEERVQVTLKDAVLFDSGRAELKPEALPELQAIAAQEKGVSNDIVVDGHTDDVPIRHGKYGSNYELSMARAYAVVRFLVQQGIDPKRISGAGYGEYHPIADNRTPQGRSRNRRIEIDLLRTQ